MLDYKDAGVDKEEGYKAVQLYKEYSEKTSSENSLNGLGSFAALYNLSGYKNPVLVSGTDGVGTKLKVAFQMNKYDSVGIDCVAMCVNDILCHGASPLFFLDYLACGQLEAEKAAEIVKGISEGCLLAECSLLGGETAEMPGFYKKGDYDIAGFAVGAVEKDRIINGKKINEGDVLISLASSGVHSNGFSLIRKIIGDLDLDLNGKSVGEHLLEPTRIYVKPIKKLLTEIEVKGMAHITGGGLYENVPRMTQSDLSFQILKSEIDIPEIFSYIEGKGINSDEMFKTFNMGIGFVVCVSEENADNAIKILRSCGENAKIIGSVIKGNRELCLI